MTAEGEARHRAAGIMHDAGIPGCADPAPDEPKSELGYARRLIAVYGDRLRYVPAWRRWLVWDGKRWAHDSTGQAARWMKSIARLVTSDAFAEEDEKNARPPSASPAAVNPQPGYPVHSPWQAPRRKLWLPRTTWTRTRSC